MAECGAVLGRRKRDKNIYLLSYENNHEDSHDEVVVILIIIYTWMEASVR